MPAAVRSIYPSPARAGGIKMAVIGTSLVQQNHAATSTKISNWSKGWLTWAKILGPEFNTPVWHDIGDVYGRNFYGANHGVSGQKSFEIVTRLTRLINMKPDIVVVDNGTNEMGSDSLETIIRNSKTIYDTLRQAGIQVIILPVLARAVSSWAANSTNYERKKAHAVNQWRKAYAAANGCYFFDWNQAWVDYANANGEPRAGFSDDGIHFNVRGAYAVGKAFAAFLSTIFQPRQPFIVGQDDVFDVDNNPTGNVFPNPNMLGTTGTLGTAATGQVATYLRGERTVGTAVTVACSKQSRGVGLGDWQVMTFTPAGTASERFLLRTATADIAHTIPVGTWVQGAVDIDIPNAYEGWRSIQLYIKDQGSGVTALGNEEYDLSGLQFQPGDAWSGRLSTEPFQIGTGVGAQQLRMRLETELLGSVAGAPVIKAASFVVRPVQDPRYLWF